MLWLSRKKIINAIDLGNCAIKILQAQISGGAVKSIKQYTCPSPGLESLEHGDTGPLVAALKEAAGAMGITKAEVISFLGGQPVVTRQIMMPPMPPEELAKSVVWEAEKLLPLPTDEMEIRHVVLEEKEAGVATQLSVLLVAAPKTLLYRYYNIFEMAGLKLTAVDLPALNLWRVFSGPYCAPEIKSTQAVVDIGSSSSYFIVVKNNRLTYVRSIYTGGSAGENSNNNPDDDLTIVYGRELPPSDGAYAEAAATVEYGGISGLVNYDQYSDFITEVRRSLDFYRLQDREAAIEQLVITGGGSKAAHLSALLENELGIAVKEGHASFSPGNGITDLDPQFTMAFGLALGEVPR